MEIYVIKIKKKLFKERDPYPYRLVFHQHGYCTFEYFRTENELYTRLIEKRLYKQKFFPKEILSIQQFIDKGFSIYY